MAKKETYQTTAKFVREMAKSKLVCSEWRSKIESQFPTVFETTESEPTRELVSFGKNFNLTTQSDTLMIGRGMAPGGIEYKCLILCADIEMEVEGRVLKFYRKVSGKEVLVMGETDTVEVPKTFLDEAYAASGDNDVLRGKLKQEFGEEAFAADMVDFGAEFTVNSASSNPMYIAVGYAPEERFRYKMISLNEEDFDITETKDCMGNRAFVFRPKK